MMNKKMTKKDWFAMVIAVVESSESEKKAEMIEFLNHEVELLSKKNSRTGQTKTQKENEVLLGQLKVALAEFEKPVTISDFMKGSAHEVATLSNQKLSALMKKLVDAGEVVKTIDKKKSHFSLVRE